MSIVKASGVERIVVFNHQGIGDVVHMLPLLENIRHEFPHAFVSLIIGSKEKSEVVRNGLVDEFVIYKSRSLSQIKNLRKRRYDLGIVNVVTDYYKGIVFLKFVLGCKTVISEAPINYSSKRLVLTKRNEQIHRVERNLSLVKNYGIPVFADKPKIKADNIIDYGDALTVGICVGTGATTVRHGFTKIKKKIKHWPPESIKEITVKLLEDGHRVVLIGGRQEKYVSTLFEDCTDPMLINLIGKTSINESIDNLAACNVVVGGDTGLIHIAAALNKPIVALFGPTPPCQFAPYNTKTRILEYEMPCKYCYCKESLLKKCYSNDCMKNIKPEAVLHEIYGMVNEISEE